jgi:hypothetical protein
MIDLNSFTREDFAAVPVADPRKRVECDSVIIMSTDELHESGHRLMEFVAVADHEMLCRIASRGLDAHDVFRLGDASWQCDCLRESGFLRLWPVLGKLRILHDTATVHIINFR